MIEKKKRTTALRTKHTMWSITCYNDDLVWAESWRDGKSDMPNFIKSITGGVEKCPSTGKYHFQGALRTTSIYMTKVKSVLPTAHIEPVRNPTALEKYCLKDDTAVGEKSVKINKQYHTIDTFLDLVADKAYNYLALNDTLEGVEYDSKGKDISYLSYSSMVVADNPKLVSLASQPQSMRAWNLYRHVFFKRAQQRSEDDLPIVLQEIVDSKN